MFSVQDLIKVEQARMKPEMAEFHQLAATAPNNPGLE